MQKDANLVELEKCCQTHIFLQNFVLIQPRTSPPKICKILQNFANFPNFADPAVPREVPRDRGGEDQGGPRAPRQPRSPNGGGGSVKIKKKIRSNTSSVIFSQPPCSGRRKKVANLRQHGAGAPTDAHALRGPGALDRVRGVLARPKEFGVRG